MTTITTAQAQALRKVLAAVKANGLADLAAAVNSLPTTAVPATRFPTQVDTTSGRMVCRNVGCAEPVRITDAGNHGVICATHWEELEIANAATPPAWARAIVKKAPARRAPAEKVPVSDAPAARCHPDRPAFKVGAYNCADCHQAAKARRAARKG